MRFNAIVTGIICLAVGVVLLFALYGGYNSTPTAREVEVGVESGEVTLRNQSGTQSLKEGQKALVGADGAVALLDSAAQSAVLSASAGAIDQAAASAQQSSATDIQSGTRETYTVSGHVKAEDGKIIAGSRIAAQQNETDVQSVYSDSDGNYRLALTEAGSYHLLSLPPRGFFESSADVVLSASHPNTTLDFTHRAGALAVRGKVIDKKTSEPIAGADILMAPHHEYPNPEQSSVKAKSDSKGDFEFPRLSKGVYYLVAKAAGYVRFYHPWGSGQPLSSIRIDEKTQGNELLVEMEPGCVVIFHVLDPLGRSVSEALIRIYAVGRDTNALEQGKTDDKGIWKADTLVKVQGIAIARRPPYGEAISDSFVPGSKEEPINVQIRLTEPASVSGRVAYKDGSPAEGADMLRRYLPLKNAAGNPDLIGPGLPKTDADGRYRIEGMGEGSYELSVLPHPRNGNTSSEGPSRTIDIKPGQDLTDIDFVVDETEKGTEEIQGRIISDSGKPVADAEVSVVIQTGKPGNEPGIHGNGKTNDLGEFHFKELVKADHFSLYVRAAGYADHNQDYPMNGEYLTITLKSASSVKGIVIGKESRLPIAGAAVTMSAYNTKTTTTGYDGTFLIENIQPWTYLIYAEAEGYSKSEPKRIKIEAGQNMEDVLIELESGSEFTGIVLAPNREPVEGASISMISKINTGMFNPFASQDSGPIPESAVSGGDGMFHIKDLSSHGDIIITRHRNFAEKRLQVTPDLFGEKPVEIILSSGGTIEGTVLDQQGNPVSNRQISVGNPTGLIPQSTVTDRNGEYRLEHVPAKPVLVVKQGAPTGHAVSLDAETKTVAVQEGKTVRVDFGAQRGITIRGTVFKGNSPVPDAPILLAQADVDPSVTDSRQFARSEQDGSYIFHDVPEGDLLFLYTADSKQNYLDLLNNDGIHRLTVTKAQQEYVVDLYVQSYEIVGTVRDKETGEPLPDVEIQGLMGVQMLSGFRTLAPARSDSSGHFVLKPKAPGTYQVVAMKKGYANKQFAATVEPPGSGISSTPIEIALSRPTVSLEVHLQFQRQPVQADHASFFLIADGLMCQMFSEPAPDQRGVFFLRDLNEGLCEFAAFVYGYSSTRSLVAFPDPVRLEKGQSGRVFADMLEYESYSVQLETDTGALVNGEGQFEIPGYPKMTQFYGSQRISMNSVRLIAPAGPCTVRLKVPGYRMAEFIPSQLASPAPVSGMRYLTLRLERE